MKEVDTEAPVVWPAWCYSGNISSEDLKESSQCVTISSSSSCSSSLSSSSDIASSVTSLNNSATVTLTANFGNVIGLANELKTKRKSHFATQPLSTESVDDINIAQNHQIVKNKKKPKTPLSLFVPDQQQSGLPSVLHQPLQVQSKAVYLFDKEKMLSDRIFLSGYNAIESSKKLCDSSSSAYLFLEKVKNETQMESLKDSESVNNNNVNSSNNNNNIINNNNNNNIVSSNNPSSNCNANNSNITISSNNNSNSNTSNNSVKKERHSPGTNGDAQFSLSRSRSATPSSFRGTPPQATHNNDLQLHNLSTNLLSQIQSRSSDFSTRNYSDFMRSLAAKYNNSNPNDSGTSRRNTFFENSKVSQPKSAINNSTNNNGSSLKEQPSPSESLKSTQNVQNLATNASSVPPFVQNFLSSLPFSPGVFPPLIDMSSTQALVTLARAAKEAEIKNILMSAQKRTSLSNNTSSRSPGPNLTAALQQAAQFASPALLYSAQLQQQQQQQQQQQSQNRQSSPNQDTSANNSGEKHLTTSPLDLSSAPPTKRFKAESTSSGSSDKSPDPDNVPGTSGGVVIPTAASSPQAKVPVAHAQNESFITTATPTTTPVGPLRQCQAQSDEVNAWTIEDVCTFVGSIDICVIYVKNFREQCIDGSGLPLLTEDHLMNQLGMRLGPALKLRSMLSKKLGGPCPCVSCSSQAQLLAAAQAAAVTVATSSTPAAPTPLGGITGNNHQLFSARNPAICSSSISHTAAAASAAVQRSNSCSGSIPRPGSADSGS